MAGQARGAARRAHGPERAFRAAREKIAAMRQAGADVLVIRADVSVESEMRAALRGSLNPGRHFAA